MVRPQKPGIDYFPLDVYMEQDDKIALIEAKYGLLGFGVIIKLYKKIYADKGYYYDWNERSMILFTKYAGVELEQLKAVIVDALEWELFDKKLFNKYGILTSKRIQKTYLTAAARKKKVELYQEYLLNGVNDDENKDNVYIYPLGDDINPHIKVKEKETKVNKNRYGEYVLLTTDEFNKLKEQFGEVKTQDKIENLDLYIGSKGKKYKSHYMTILSWDKKDNNKPEKWRTT